MKFCKLLIILISSVILKKISISTVSASHYQPLVRVNSVSQLAEVNHQDWAFQALKSLQERYGYSAKSIYSDNYISRQQFAVHYYNIVLLLSPLFMLKIHPSLT